jgi:hypothetical protein
MACVSNNFFQKFRMKYGYALGLAVRFVQYGSMAVLRDYLRKSLIVVESCHGTGRNADDHQEYGTDGVIHVTGSFHFHGTRLDDRRCLKKSLRNLSVGSVLP